MLTNQRIIHGDGATLRDRSVELNSIFAGAAVLDLAVTDDYLYIGSDLPFNHRYFQVSVANAVVSAVSVDIWDGSSWVAAVDVVDQTASAGACFAQSGFISWATPRGSSWGKEETTENVTGLTTLKIYNLYWVRLKVSASLTGTTAMTYVGHRFATDADLGGYYPDLIQSNVMTAHTSGKSTWADQHFLAAEEMIQDIRRKGIAWNANQLLDWEQFNIAGIHRVAALIMSSMGADFVDARARSLADYREAMSVPALAVDANEDGHKDEEPKRSYGGEIFRR